MKLGVRRPVELRLSHAVHGPVTTGLWRPVVLLPEDMTRNLQPDELDSVLLHELAHLRRHDLLVHSLATWARIVFCLHPAAWWTFRAISRERELIADGIAMRHGGVDPRRYGRTLLKVAAQCSPGAPTLALAMNAEARALAGRLRQLGTSPSRTPHWLVAPVYVLLGLFLVQGCIAHDAHTYSGEALTPPGPDALSLVFARPHTPVGPRVLAGADRAARGRSPTRPAVPHAA